MRLFILTQKNSIRVKPLPKEAPVGFKNAVGQFEIASDSVVKEVKKGVPFYFTVRLKGVGNLDRLQFPALVSNKDYRVYPPKNHKKYSRYPARNEGEFSC
ncbi:hypothetical protein RIA_0399 [Riemerella anatipestifer RA-GD]|uniref:BatD family protein n=1 Tax=Riemerella anatipestifer TaxID=34085 RepID=UPI0002012394|nr:BatD family protein [Riemerella anatipestifer]ADZ11568.1 hypothetical protein RIA_0399 [Riemerella anatipestifer RA-GD]